MPNCAGKIQQRMLAPVSTSGSACCLLFSLSLLFLPLPNPSFTLASSSLDHSHLHILLGLRERKRLENRPPRPYWPVLIFMSVEIMAERSTWAILRSARLPYTTSPASIFGKQMLTPLRFWVVHTYCECQGSSHTFKSTLLLVHSPHEPVLSCEIQQIY